MELVQEVKELLIETVKDLIGRNQGHQLRAVALERRF